MLAKPAGEPGIVSGPKRSSRWQGEPGATKPGGMAPTGGPAAALRAGWERMRRHHGTAQRQRRTFRAQRFDQQRRVVVPRADGAVRNWHKKTVAAAPGRDHADLAEAANIAERGNAGPGVTGGKALGRTPERDDITRIV